MLKLTCEFGIKLVDVSPTGMRLQGFSDYHCNKLQKRMFFHHVCSHTRTLIPHINVYNSLVYFQDVFVLEFSHDQHLSPAECSLLGCENLSMEIKLKANTANELYVKKAKKQKAVLKVLGKDSNYSIIQHKPKYSRTCRLIYTILTMKL